MRFDDEGFGHADAGGRVEWAGGESAGGGEYDVYGCTGEYADVRVGVELFSRVSLVGVLVFT